MRRTAEFWISNGVAMYWMAKMTSRRFLGAENCLDCQAGGCSIKRALWKQIDRWPRRKRASRGPFNRCIQFARPKYSTRGTVRSKSVPVQYLAKIPENLHARRRVEKIKHTVRIHGCCAEKTPPPLWLRICCDVPIGSMMARWMRGTPHKIPSA